MKKKIAISAINLFEGGTLSVLKDCLQAIEKSDILDDWEFLALVHKKSLFNESLYKKVTFVEFPKSRKSYLYRLYYEYFYFNKYAKVNSIDFWFSIHDLSPNVGTIPQAVYCHNPSPFKKISLNDLIIQPTFFLFTLFYAYMYKINLKKNKFVVVQQLWLKNEFNKRFGVQCNKIVIAKPQEYIVNLNNIDGNLNKAIKSFVFPTYPRSFKNIEIIGEAVRILNKEGVEYFNVTVTIDGSENKYSKMICDKYGKLKHLKFIGLQPREAVFRLYNESDCLIFPSTLETWGLPISEYKQYDKPMLVANFPYAKETVGGYHKAKFFKYNDAKELASYMKELIVSGKIECDDTKAIHYPKPYVQDWEALMALLLT
jgi:glycosyltransferase involved in cell wall biosynthesis